MSAFEELQGFVTLQRLLTRRAELRRERDTPPAELAALRAAGEERAQRIAMLEQRREALQAEQSRLQREAEELREERDHFRKQKSQVTNMKQLQAVVSELDFAESQLKAREDRLMEIWQELEGIDGEATPLQEESPEEREQREAAEHAWEGVRRSCEEELLRVDNQLRHTQRALGRTAVAAFKKLWTSRRPNAVVPLDGTSCSACHAELRPSLVQQVRAGDGLQYCDSCRRLLFDPEKL